MSLLLMDILLHNVMKRVQACQADLLPELVNVEEEISTCQSLRCTFTMQAQNVGIPKEVVEVNNHWRKHMHLKGFLPSMEMIE